MVTQQQPGIETPTPPRRSRRGPLVAAAVAVVAILAGVGIAFATGTFESEGDTAAERLAVASDLVDTWMEGRESPRDPELVASVFTDDGVYIDPGGSVVTMEEMQRYVRASATAITNTDRIELIPSGDNTYTWVQEFDAGHANRFGGDAEIELEGDLAKRIAWLSGYEEIGPASGS